ncbi:hypothetical protein D2E71_21285 [Mycobacteroides abscessus]|uniref:Secreted protein n=1 Tax=Mycobacteroides immunogenum TaxID=83262 RepID=A0ABR5LM29_9MYCO|nr:hypothetical protein MAUC22_15425 [Mycobacteroides abscessus UC22]KPG28057.1 hypothetical protein AN912_22260 [Mycobacteroides immunogenum]RIR30674.1 hypothetical protein D2E38_23015 [Mycobacteroides abscessus]RIR39976.1 hypothetical protein D2E36_14745 [Mycobacteroides abscessus]RIS40473.1 hypothetical protein D2E71_21285 [Mycobacteroides abscessus]
MLLLWLLSVVEAQSFRGAAQSGGDTHSVRNSGAWGSHKTRIRMLRGVPLRLLIAPPEIIDTCLRISTA